MLTNQVDPEPGRGVAVVLLNGPETIACIRITRKHGSESTNKQVTHLEGIFSGEALVAERAGERLHGQVDALMPLQVVVPVEGLRALIALERPVVLWRRRLTVVRAVHVRQMAVRRLVGIPWHAHAANTTHTPEHCHLAAWVAKSMHPDRHAGH